MASKRLKKKQLKKRAGLEGQRVSQAQLETLQKKEAQKRKRDAATTRRYNSNKNYLKSVGVPTDIITKSTSIKETKKRAEEYLKSQAKSDRQIRQANLVARKINRLIDSGFSYEEAKAKVGSFWRPISEKEIDRIIHEKTAPTINENIPLKGKNYLYVGVCEIKDGFHVPNTASMTAQELKDFTRDILRAAKNNPDGSASFASAFAYSKGTKARMERRAERFYNRGYDMNPEHMKLTPERYQKITVSNTWSEHDFFAMFYTCASQMKNADVLDFNDYLKDYCISNGFPFMDDFPYLDKK